MVRRRCGMLLEMQLLDLLPSSHDASTASDSDVSPHGIEVLVVDGANVVRFAGEGGQIVALERMVVICHSVSETSYDGLCDICTQLVWRVLKGDLLLTLVLWLCRSGIASNHILGVIRS